MDGESNVTNETRVKNSVNTRKMENNVLPTIYENSSLFASRLVVRKSFNFESKTAAVCNAVCGIHKGALGLNEHGVLVMHQRGKRNGQHVVRTHYKFAGEKRE